MKNEPELRFVDSDGNPYPEWQNTKLGEISTCLDSKRKPLNSQEREAVKGSIPYYGANGIQGYVNDFLFDEPLVLLAEDGGNFNDFSTRPIAQFTTGKSWVNNHTHVLRALESSEFLFYSLVHKDIRRYINGTSRSKLNQEDMLKIKINKPSIEEQTKIGTFYTLLDKRITLQQEKIDSLTEYKKGLLQQVMNRELRFRDEGNEYPEWEEKKLGDVCDVYDGTHQTPKYTDDGVRFVSVEDISDITKSKKYISTEDFKRDFKRYPQRNDILMTRIGDIGTPYLLRDDEEYAYYVTLALIKTKDKSVIYSPYLVQWIKSQKFQKELYKRTLHVAFPKKINMGEIGKCMVSVPTIEEQQKIATLFSALDQKIEKEKEKLELIKEMKKGYMQKMFV